MSPLTKKTTPGGAGSDSGQAATKATKGNDTSLDAAFEFVILRWFTQLPFGISPDLEKLSMWCASRLREVAR